MRYIHEGLTLSNEELEKAKREEKARVLENGKLTLILDLDHTLLNSSQFKELSQEQHDLLRLMMPKRVGRAQTDCAATRPG